VFLSQAAEGLGDADDDDDAGGRKGGQFKTHLKKSEAASEFSRTKTIAQQRRSLPVYTVKEELLQVSCCACNVCFWRAPGEGTGARAHSVVAGGRQARTAAVLELLTCCQRAPCVRCVPQEQLNVVATVTDSHCCSYSNSGLNLRIIAGRSPIRQAAAAGADQT